MSTELLFALWNSLPFKQQQRSQGCGAAVAQITYSLLWLLKNKREVIETLCDGGNTVVENTQEALFEILNVPSLDALFQACEMPSQTEIDVFSANPMIQLLRMLATRWFSKDVYRAVVGTNEVGVSPRWLAQWMWHLLHTVWYRVNVHSRLSLDDVDVQLQHWFPVPVLYMVDSRDNPYAVSSERETTWLHYGVLYHVDDEYVYLLNPFGTQDKIPVEEFVNRRSFSAEYCRSFYQKTLKTTGIIRPNTGLLIH